MIEGKKIMKMLAKFENRLTKLEKIVFPSPSPAKKGPQKYRGLSGGIQFIIDNGFFNKQREVKEVISELKREGYHYSNESIAKLVPEDRPFAPDPDIQLPLTDNRLHIAVIQAAIHKFRKSRNQ